MRTISLPGGKTTLILWYRMSHSVKKSMMTDTKQQETCYLQSGVGTDKNICDKERCSLGKCVVEIDEKLQSRKFTFRSNNPGVIKAPPVIRDYIERA